MRSYARFMLMIATATVIMYGVMYLNTYAWDHVHFSETRLYMALLMGSTMAVVMLLFMGPMYTNRRVNASIVAASIGVFALALWLERGQSAVEDASWMNSMIPHHSIAILTSERARLSDPRVRELADSIIATQRREIQEIKELLTDLESR